MDLLEKTESWVCICSANAYKTYHKLGNWNVLNTDSHAVLQKAAQHTEATQLHGQSEKGPKISSSSTFPRMVQSLGYFYFTSTYKG